MKRILPVLLVLALLLCGCGNTQQQTQISESSKVSMAYATMTPEAYFSNRDLDSSYDSAKSIRIALEGDTASCDAAGVTVDGSTVTITAPGTYLLSGALDDGQIRVNVQKDEKVQLVLAGASIHSQTSTALYILQADKVFVTTAAGTENTCSNGGTFEAIDDQNIDGAIFSKEDITFNGEGALYVTSPAGHGVVSKDSLTVTSGMYEITCASHGLAGKDDVSVAGGNLTIVAGKDGIHAENTEEAALGTVYITDGMFSITAEGDGIAASAAMQIDGGDFTILAGGGSKNGQEAASDNWGHMGGKPENMGRPGDMGGRPGEDPGAVPEQEDTTDSTSMKGIKAGTDLVIQGGSFTIDCADDGIHANGSMTVAGGSFTIATGDDGVHAEDTLAVLDGTIVITESYEGLEALHVLISGGEITLTASDDGLNAAGGMDNSGMGGRDGMFGDPGAKGEMGRPGGMSVGNGSVTISGGTLHITASGDGIDANGTLCVTGGSITVCGPTQGDTATLDYDASAIISGGTFIGTGGSGMAQTFSDSEQGVISFNAGNQNAGTQIVLTDGNGNTVIDHTPALPYSLIILSSPNIKKGETYTITVGSHCEKIKAS